MVLVGDRINRNLIIRLYRLNSSAQYITVTIFVASHSTYISTFLQIKKKQRKIKDSTRKIQEKIK